MSKAVREHLLREESKEEAKDEALDFLDDFYRAKRYLYVPNIVYVAIGEILKKAGRLK